MLRLVDGDRDTFAAQMAALVATQRVTARRVLRNKQQRALTAAQVAAQTLATLIDDLEHDRMPFQVGGSCDIDELDEMLREAGEFREVAIAVELLDPPEARPVTGSTNSPSPPPRASRWWPRSGRPWRVHPTHGRECGIVEFLSG